MRTRFRRYAVWTLLALALGFAAPPGPAAAATAPGPIPSSEFVTRLENASSIATQHIDSPSSEAMTQVKDAVGYPVFVQLPWGPQSITTDPLLDSLQGNTGFDFRVAQSHLDSEVETIQSSAGDLASIDSATVRRQLDAIYKSTPSAKPSRISRFASQGTDWLARSLGGLFGSIFHPNGGKTVVVWLIIGTLITLLVWLWRRSKFGIVPEKTSAIGAQAEERIDWRARADEALARGDLAEAVRCLYHAMLVAFASTGIVEDAPSLTSGEFRTAVGKKRPAMYPQVAGATRVFERVAYGNSIPEARDVDQMRTAERAVRK